MLDSIMDVQAASILQGAEFKKLLNEQYAQLRRKFDIKVAELEILYYLTQCEGHNTSTDIHCQLMMNRGHISQAVDSLRRRGLIAAIPDQTDRRYVHYQIQDSAQEIVDEIVKRWEALNEQILEGISDEELRVFRDVSIKMKANIERILAD